MNLPDTTAMSPDDYEDLLAREGGRWRFKRRLAFVDIGKPIE